MKKYKFRQIDKKNKMIIWESSPLDIFIDVMKTSKANFEKKYPQFTMLIVDEDGNIVE